MDECFRPDPSFVYLDVIMASQMETADAVDVAFQLAELAMKEALRRNDAEYLLDVTVPACMEEPPDDNTDYEETFSKFWAPIVMLNGVSGEIDLDQIKRELHGYWCMLREVPQVYMHVTNGMISKPNTCAFEVIAEHDDLATQLCEEREDEIRSEFEEYLFEFAELAMTMAVRLYEQEMYRDRVRRTLKAFGFANLCFPDRGSWQS